MSFEASSPPDISSGCQFLARDNTPGFTLEHVSLDDWKPEYLQFCTEHPTQSSRSQVDSAWCKQFELEPRLAASNKDRTSSKFTWGEYIALSYTWGSLEEKKTITVNGVPVTVGKNLAAALDRLRFPAGDKIWVDALCINQDDVCERNAHVLRIREIFSLSFAVTI